MTPLVCARNQRVWVGVADFLRGRHGGVEKRGGWKTSRMTPLPKRGFGPPLVRYVFHPPQVSVLCFFCTKIHDRADQKLFWRGPKIFGRARSLVRFPPPYILHSPYHGPNTCAKASWDPKCTTILRTSAVAAGILLLPSPQDARFPSDWKSLVNQRIPKGTWKRQQPWNDAKSHAPRWVSDSSFHGCWLGLSVVWRLLWVQLLPPNDGRVEKSSFHGCCRLGTPGDWIGKFQSRSFVAVVVSCGCLGSPQWTAIFSAIIK